VRDEKNMNPSLKEFFENEKKRVFTPDDYFSTRVMARLREARRNDFAIWDVIPGTTRPVFGLAFVLMLAVLGAQMFLPQAPERGFLSSLIEAEQAQSEAPFLYSGADIPADHELLNQLMGFEEQ
jgi:hypothetical protein